MLFLLLQFLNKLPACSTKNRRVSPFAELWSDYRIWNNVSDSERNVLLLDIKLNDYEFINTLLDLTDIATSIFFSFVNTERKIYEIVFAHDRINLSVSTPNDNVF